MVMAARPPPGQSPNHGNDPEDYDDGGRVVKATALLLLAASLLLHVRSADAQSAVLTLPDLSQHARVAQRIGLTDITVDYHRPLAAGRKIFGGLEPYGEVWRAGANYNTTIEV